MGQERPPIVSLFVSFVEILIFFFALNTRETNQTVFALVRLTDFKFSFRINSNKYFFKEKKIFMKSSCCCTCRLPVAIVTKLPIKMSSVSLPSKVSIRFAVVPCGTSLFGTRRTVDMNSRVVFGGARASMVDSYESSSDFARRTEQAWLISQVFFFSNLGCLESELVSV